MKSTTYYIPSDISKKKLANERTVQSDSVTNFSNEDILCKLLNNIRPSLKVIINYKGVI